MATVKKEVNFHAPWMREAFQYWDNKAALQEYFNDLMADYNSVLESKLADVQSWIPEMKYAVEQISIRLTYELRSK